MPEHRYKRRDWHRTWGRYPEHYDGRKNLNESWRFGVDLYTWIPGWVSARRDRNAREAFNLTFAPELRFAVGLKRRASTMSVRLRYCHWHTFTISLVLIFFQLDIKVRWPRWEQSREEYLADLAIHDRLEGIRRRAIAGCTSTDRVDHSFAATTEQVLNLPEQVEMIDGQPVVVTPLAYVPCARWGSDRHRHWIWDREDGEFVRTAEYSSTRKMREAREAKQLSEVTKMIAGEQ